MKAFSGYIVKILLVVMLFTAIAPMVTAYAAGDMLSEGNEMVSEALDAVNRGGEKVRVFAGKVLQQIISFIPYVGVGLFVIGIFVAIFSIRNKGNRRWGLKLAITESIICFVLYISLTLIYDFVCNGATIRFSERPAQETFYEKTYYDTIERMKAEGQSFLLLGEDWLNGVASAGRSLYLSIVALLVYTSLSIGIILLLVTKRDKSFRRFALAGLCIASPLTLIIGAIFLGM